MKQLRGLIREAIESQAFRRSVVEVKGCKHCDDTGKMLCKKCKGVQGRKSCDECWGAGELDCSECSYKDE